MLANLSVARGIFAAALVLVTETLFSVLGAHIRHTPEFKIKLHYRQKPALDQVMRLCKDSKVSITDLRVASDSEDAGYSAVLSLRPRFTVNRDVLLGHIRAIHGVMDVEET